MNKQDFSVCVILPTRDCSTEKKSNFSLRSVLFVTQSSVLQNITRTVTSPEIRRYMTTFLNFFATFISRFQHQIKLKLRLENSTIKKKMQCLVFCFLFVHISHEFVRMIWEYPSVSPSDLAPGISIEEGGRAVAVCAGAEVERTHDRTHVPALLPPTDCHPPQMFRLASSVRSSVTRHCQREIKTGNYLCQRQGQGQESESESESELEGRQLKPSSQKA